MFSTSRIFLLIFLFALVCNSCTPTSSPKPGIFRIVCFGDSTTAVRENIRKVYAAGLRDYFNRSHSSTRFQVINAGVRSDTTRRARARFEKDVLRHSPHLVIIQFGLNDSCIDVFKGETGPRVSLEEYLRHLIYFIQILRQQDSRVILMTQNPMIWTPKTRRVWGKPPYDTTDRWGFNLLNQDYAEAVRRIAIEQKIPLVDVYNMFLDYDSRPSQNIDQLMVDGIHPNHKGHRKITSALISIIKKQFIREK